MTQRFVSLKSLEMAILGAVAFVTSGALVRFVSSNDADLVTTGDVRFEIILALCYAAVLLIFLFHLVPGFRATFYTPATPALLILACSSALWAELPGLVLRRAAGLAGATLFGVVLASRLTFAEQLLLLRRVLRVIAFLSLAAWVLGLLFGVHLVTGSSTAAEGIWSSDAGGPWRGIFNHKNVLGSAVALALLAEWHIPAGAVAARASKAVWMCAYAALLALSNSITSAVTLVLTIVVMYAIKSFRGRYGLVLPAGLVAMLF
ncbi:MAG TPA: hypothetical protein VKG84_14425, partial [Candidatus Acidoferrales bacterium]|nr:hypothetical protein [Candidatus Acidoferrales bacterium]